MDADAATDERGLCVRQNRVVLTPRRWRQVLKKLTLLASDGGKKAVHRGDHDISRKAIAQGRPDALRWTCMLVCVFFAQLHTRPRVQRAPGLPCALFQGGREVSWQTSGVSRREIADSCGAEGNYTKGNADDGAVRDRRQCQSRMAAPYRC